MRDVVDRIVPKVELDDSGCWLWRAASRGDGSQYGALYVGSSLDGTARVAPAHRVAWEVLVGEIPAGFELDHLCKNTLCINPDHLEPVPPRVNNARSNSPTAVNARKSECIRGHPFTEENTYRRAKTPGRTCKACERAWKQQKKRRAQLAHLPETEETP